MTFIYDVKDSYMKESNEPFVTIIIPAYNAEKYILKTLHSCLNQTYKNIEVVVVNDGSTDKTENKIRGIKNEKIRFFSGDNYGPSHARNIGIREAKGEWLVFLDADDWLEDNAIFDMVAMQKEMPNYLLGVGYYACNELNQKKQRIDDDLEDICLIRQDAYMAFGKRYNLLSACFKLFDSGIIKKNNILFPEDIFNGEDGVFVFKYLKYVDGYNKKSIAYWNVLMNSCSTTRSGYSPRWITMCKAVDELLNTDEVDKNEELKIHLKKFRSLRTFICMVACCKNVLDYRDDYKYLKREMRKWLFYFLISDQSFFAKIKYVFLSLTSIRIVALCFRNENK